MIHKPTESPTVREMLRARCDERVVYGGKRRAKG
jgi:hypothetical protein